MHTYIHTTAAKLSVAAATVALLATLSPLSAFAAVTEVVSGNTSAGENQPGWLFNRDTDTQSPYTFNFDEASIGNGALYVEPIANNIHGNADKFIAELFTGTAMADLNALSYDFLIGGGGAASDANQFYLSVYANFGSSDPNNFYDCRYSVVPVSGSTSDWTTVTFDPTATYPVTTSGSSLYVCPASPADMDSLSAGSVVRVFAINVGDTSASDQDLDGYLDNVVLDTTADVVTYDFEPTAQTKDDCMSGGWEAFGFKNQGQCVASVVSHSDNH